MTDDAKALATQNMQLKRTLREARDQLASLREQLVAMTRPPLTFGLVTALVPSGEVDVQLQGRVVRTTLAPDVATPRVGDRALVNEQLVVCATLPADPHGELAMVVEADADAAIVRLGSDAELRCGLADDLRPAPPQAGESVLIDRAARLVVARVARRHVEELVLAERPDVTYADIGGLAAQIEQITDAVELPFRRRDDYRRYRLRAPKGVLLYGPPGVGKTMIAKAVANSLSDGTGDSFFLNIKGPELLTKYVGESERQIRLIFDRARSLAADGRPVIVFFDEMDALFRARGTGVSSDIENTVVPQLLSEIDGVEALANVIIIGASNREDMLDPALMRPGRLDVKIRLGRPDRDAAADILAKYVTDDLPLADPVADLIAATVEQVYDRAGLSDVISGAMLRNIVDRAKKAAIKRELTGRPGGLSVELLADAVAAEAAEAERP